MKKIIENKILEYNLLRLFCFPEEITKELNEILELIRNNIPLIEQPKYLRQIQI